jgi:hypothetical protein
MSELTNDIRVKLAVEAGRRGTDLDAWWNDMRSTLPAEIRVMKEGSGSWAMAAAHLLIHPVTDKWRKLTTALAFASHASMAASQMSGVRLPAMIGSRDRVLGAVNATARRLGASYGAYYGAMHDVAGIIADRMQRAGNKAGAERVRLAGGLWKIRSRVASTLTVHDDVPNSRQAGVVRYIDPSDSTQKEFVLTTAPYSAYKLWHTALNTCQFISRDVKAQFPLRSSGVVSKCFQGKSLPVFKQHTGASARLFRYVNDPSLLSEQIERTLAMINSDLDAVAEHYATEGDEMLAGPDTRIVDVHTELRIDTRASSPLLARIGIGWAELTRQSRSIS